MKKGEKRYVIVLRGDGKLYFRVNSRVKDSKKYSSADVVAVINLRNLVYAYRYRKQLLEIIETVWRVYAPVIYRLRGGVLEEIGSGGKRRALREDKKNSR